MNPNRYGNLLGNLSVKHCKRVATYTSYLPSQHCTSFSFFAVPLFALFSRCDLKAVALECFEALKNLLQRQFIFQIHLVIKIRAKPIFMALAVLRHHNNRGLESANYPKHEI